MHFNENAAKSLEALLKKFVTGVSAASSNTNTSSLSNAVNTANSNLMAHIHASITYLKYVIEYFNVLRNIDIKIRTVVKAALNIVKGEMKNKEGVDMTNFKELHDKLLEIDKRPE
jgi:GTP1/Obg family GTP-binding protein